MAPREEEPVIGVKAVVTAVALAEKAKRKEAKEAKEAREAEAMVAKAEATLAKANEAEAEDQGVGQDEKETKAKEKEEVKACYPSGKPTGPGKIPKALPTAWISMLKEVVHGDRLAISPTSVLSCLPMGLYATNLGTPRIRANSWIAETGLRRHRKLEAPAQLCLWPLLQGPGLPRCQL